AKRLYFDVIPRSVDEYAKFLAQFPDDTEPHENPVWHIHAGNPPRISALEQTFSYAMLLNLVSACNGATEDLLWKFIQTYAPDANAKNCPWLDQLVSISINYFADFIAPNKSYRLADDKDCKALQDLSEQLEKLQTHDAETIQNTIFAIGKAHGYDPLRDWFHCLYQCLLGQDSGPRFGSFVALYGVENTRGLITEALGRK
ncbi:MAG: lysine--tRNA ligase, partial [Pseudomonadota bacterium]